MTQQIDELTRIAKDYLKNGEAEAAHRTSREILATDPQNLEAMLISGQSALLANQIGAAITHFEKASKIHPAEYRVHLALSEALLKSGNGHDALKHVKKALSLNPDSVASYIQMGYCYNKLRGIQNSLLAFQNAIRLEPNTPAAYEGLGDTYIKTGEFAQAQAALEAALSQNPEEPRLFVKLGSVLQQLGQFELAGAAFAHAQDLVKSDPILLTILGQLAMQLEALSYSEEFLKMALELNAKDSETLYTLGTLYQQLGKFDDADHMLRRALQVQPTRARAYLDLVSSKRITDDDSDLISTMAQLVQSQAIGFHEKRFVHYALGKSYQDLNDYRMASRHFHEANGIMDLLYTGPRHSKQELANSVDWLINVFPNGPLGQLKTGTGENTPIFIVGMPRSGTTLIEQILSNHPEVAAGNEIPYLLENWNRLFDRKTLRILPEHFSEFIDGYEQILHSKSRGRKFVTDKMPLNFQLSALLISLFPNCKIIHCRRNLKDTLVSLFTTPFRSPLWISHDLESQATYINEYLRLMAHWRNVLPSESFMEVDYEAIIENPQFESNRLLEFCGLTWNDRCIHPEENDAPINTPSWWQARQPINRRSVERWRHYEPYLPTLNKVPETHPSL